MINKLDSRCAVVRCCYHSYDYRPNWIPLSPITITNQGLGMCNQQSASADYTSFDLDYSRYHKNLIQLLFITTKNKQKNWAQYINSHGWTAVWALLGLVSNWHYANTWAQGSQQKNSKWCENGTLMGCGLKCTSIVKGRFITTESVQRQQW